MEELVKTLKFLKLLSIRRALLPPRFFSGFLMKLLKSSQRLQELDLSNSIIKEDCMIILAKALTQT